ncbi:MAG: ABC transporter substrate-binding protein [Deferribacteraceae bacterium]|jgi:putative ABC transport system substrate-binding protein|nr:ABC transporter substrate-binding protein [Deferribacteraceae bacterium]
MRFTAILLSALFIFACTKKEETQTEEKRYKIGVAKIIAHPALDAVEKGLIDELTERGIKADYDLQSANGEFSTAASIAARFKDEKVDVAVGIATPTALALLNGLGRETPIVFSAVTDPISAGLRTSNEKDAANVTGVSDMTPVKEQIELMNRIKPIKTLGHLYNSGEANSVELYKILTEVCGALNIKLVATTVTNTSEVRQATGFLVHEKVDAIYVSTDNVVVAAMQSVTTVAEKNNIPVVSADPVSAEGSGALVAYGVDYYTAGRQTGIIIAEILNGKFAGDIPVKYMLTKDELSLYFDKSVGERLNLELKTE